MMDETARREFQRMVASYQDRGDPTGWCDQVYRGAHGDFRAVFWADLVPSPHLMSWLEEHPVSDKSLSAVTVGCGVGDDAEAMAAAFAGFACAQATRSPRLVRFTGT